MIKIIYGAENNSSVCRRIYPIQDNIGLSYLIDQSIIKSDYNEELVEGSFYSIHCVDNYYILSKVSLVYAKGSRLSYRAYMIALKEHEHSLNVLERIEQLEQQYKTGKSIQNDVLPKRIKVANSTVEKENVTVYYKRKEELERYFKIDRKYKRYNAIYFIDEERNDIINALSNSGNVISFDELISNDYGTENDGSQEENDDQHTFRQIYKNRIVILLFGILLGGLSMWGHQLLFITKDSSQSSAILYKSLVDSITTLNNKVKVLHIDLQKINKSLIDFTTPIKKAESGKIQSGTNGETLKKVQQPVNGQDSLKKNEISQQ